MKVGSLTELKKKNEENIPEPIITYPRKRTRSSEYQQHLTPRESKTQTLKVDPTHDGKQRLSSTPANMFLASVIKDNSIVLQNPYRDRSATAPSAINLQEKEQQQRDFSVMQLKTSVGGRGNSVDPRMHAYQPKKQRPVLIGKKRKRKRPSSDVSLVFFVVVDSCIIRIVQKNKCLVPTKA